MCGRDLSKDEALLMTNEATQVLLEAFENYSIEPNEIISITNKSNYK